MSCRSRSMLKLGFSAPAMAAGREGLDSVPRSGLRVDPVLVVQVDVVGAEPLQRTFHNYPDAQHRATVHPNGRKALTAAELAAW
jgi:protein involved in polysaccharide export with SLBB domain